MGAVQVGDCKVENLTTLMYIESVPNRNSPPAVLLRETWWDKDARKVRKRTLANLSRLPPELVECCCDFSLKYEWDLNGVLPDVDTSDGFWDCDGRPS